MEKNTLTKSEERLSLENVELRSRLTEAEEALNAIRNGEVDAIIVNGPESEKIFSLSSAETPYRIIVEEMNEGAVSLSADGTILYCNRRFAELISIPSEQIVGSNFALLVAESEKPKFDLLMQAGIKGRSGGEIMYFIQESNPRYFYISFSALPSNMLGVVCIMISDITELKQKEEELRHSHDTLEERIIKRTAELSKSMKDLANSRASVMNMMESTLEDRNALEIANRKLNEEITEHMKAEDSLKKSEHEFRLLAEAMPQIVWITRPDGWNIYFSQQWVEYTGLTLEESYGHGWNKPFHPDDQKRAWDAWQNATINGTTYSLECRLRRADGVYKWWLIRGEPGLTEHGTVHKWFGTCTDIDELKNSEGELTIAKLQAEESDRLKSAFLANMSHEIRTPLNAIVGFSGLFTDPDLSQEDKINYSGIIKSRSDDLLYLINDILELSRIESGNSVVTKKQISMNEILDEMEVDFRQKLQKINKTNLDLVSEKPLSSDHSQIISDKSIIKQVFSNLIGNAIKFTEAGTIRFGYQIPVNNTLTCYVSDTGIGISPENEKVIFEYFRQADIENPQKLYGGTGLGLTICRGSLALLGGKIWVESIPGEGSTFYFTIPFEQAPAPNTKPLPKPGETPSKITYNWTGKKLLLVEDEESNMEFLRLILIRTRADLVYARNGRELRDLYGSLETFDLVLLDIRLPDASGWDLAKEIKSIRSDLPVITQTAYAMTSDRQKSEEVGCDDYISKPINKDKLLAMLARYLE